jgi:hypothetical protein
MMKITSIHGTSNKNEREREAKELKLLFAVRTQTVSNSKTIGAACTITKRKNPKIIGGKAKKQSRKTLWTLSFCKPNRIQPNQKVKARKRKNGQA